MLYGVSDGGSATLERIAANDAVVAYGVHETDAGRSYLAVTDRDRGLWLLGADRLEILHGWELGPEAIGAHAVRPTDRVALISGSDAVVLMEADGRRLWRHRHPAWRQGGFETGCAWFDDEGTPFAVVPALDYSWTDEVLFDADAAGTRILTTPHATGAIKIRSFPGLEVLREIEPPPAHAWDFYACFAGAWIVARAHNDGGDDEILVAIDPDDRIIILTRTEAPICPGPGGCWISTGARGIARWRLTAQ